MLEDYVVSIQELKSQLFFVTFEPHTYNGYQIILECQLENYGRIHEDIANCHAQGGLIQRGLASARVLCPLPEYMPLISEEVQWENDEVQRTSKRPTEKELQGTQSRQNRLGGAEQRVGQEEWSGDWNRRSRAEIRTGGAERRLGQKEQSGE
ncbi:hypothetical protein BDR05DRAFT_946963 [Suillus weaverae]|nr:hypothetical protein BDR05DRAFT_946963 [Suillus weaverae]